MCTNPEGFGDEDNSAPYSASEVLERAVSRKKFPGWEYETICLTGGEPTTHPQFIDLLKGTREEFPDNEIIIATNGRMFSYMPFLEKFMSFDPTRIEIPIHGSTAKLHDAITRVPGSFDQAIAGIKNVLKIRKPHQKVEVRIIILKPNLPDIGNILKLVSEDLPGVSRVVMIFPEFEGMCAKNKEAVGVTYSEVKEKIEELVGEWSEKIKELSIYHFPLCTLPVSLWKYAWRTLRSEEVIFIDKCKECDYQEYCLGVHIDYLREIGDAEFSAPKVNVKIIAKEGPSKKYHPIIEATEE